MMWLGAAEYEERSRGLTLLSLYYTKKNKK